MIYAVLRAIAGLALRWFYRSIDVVGMERVPRRGPLLLVVNHPNALVDALVVGWVLPRRLLLTAKSTLFVNPVAAWLLRGIGVVPLQRASDLHSGQGAVDPARNSTSFRAVSERLRGGGAVLIFPEGKSHDEPSLAELRTGAARIALEAARQAGVRGLLIVPIGLHFERKERPTTRVLAQVGDPIAMDDWSPDDARAAVGELTSEIDRRLRSVTLNFDTHAEASATTAAAALLSELLTEDVPALGAVPPLEREVELARYIADARQAIGADPLRTRADVFLARLETFAAVLRARRLTVADLGVETGIGSGARFVAREASLVAVAGPIAAWGSLNHYVPFHLARAVALRRVESASDPAMRTIVAGVALVLAFYAAQTALVWRLFGAIAALVYAVSLPVAAELNRLLAARLARGRERARAYLTFRRQPGEQRSLRAELAWLRNEALSLDAALSAAPARRGA